MLGLRWIISDEKGHLTNVQDKLAIEVKYNSLIYLTFFL